MYNPEMMKMAQEQMSKMSPEQMAKMQEMAKNMDPEMMRKAQANMAIAVAAAAHGAFGGSAIEQGDQDAHMREQPVDLHGVLYGDHSCMRMRGERSALMTPRASTGGAWRATAAAERAAAAPGAPPVGS